jgi:hypothetical protein
VPAQTQIIGVQIRNTIVCWKDIRLFTPTKATTTSGSIAVTQNQPSSLQWFKLNLNLGKYNKFV